MTRIAPLLLSLTLLTTACVVRPKLPTDVAAAVARDDMRVLSTQHIDLYYPEAEGKERARAFAERLEGCLTELRKRALGRTGLSQQRLQVIHPNLPFNNAFVSTPLGGDFFTVVPTHTTFDWTTELGVPMAQDYVACHELTHYVQYQQTLRFWGGLDRVVGNVWSPQMGLDAWFAEGLATYYEQTLQPSTGRPSWPAWIGAFHAGVAQDGISGGDLSDLNRQYHWGNHYLVGSHFVAYLVYRYGETKLWELIDRQGRSFFFPFTVPSRFKRVYGRTLSQLIDDFAADAKQRFAPRAKPSEQRTIRDIGANGRYARARNGTEAVITEAMDAPTTLTLYDARGRILHSTRLTDVLPPRKVAVADPRLISGLSFEASGDDLYWVAIDQGPVYQAARLMHMEVASGRIERLVDDVSGTGGSVSPDGRSYYFVRNDVRGQSLRAIDLATKAQRTLFGANASTRLSPPAVSPDGTRLVAGTFDGGYGLSVFDARTGRRESTLSMQGRALTDPSFADDGRLLFVAAEANVFQVFVHDFETNQTTQVTHAPYLALHARESQGVVRFFNREGWQYTLDEVPLPLTAAPRASATGPSLVPGPIAVLPEPARLDLSRAHDEPYHVFPALLIPTVRTPYLTYATTGSANRATRGYPSLGAQLLGSDPLGYHRWGLEGALQLGTNRPSGAFSYINAQLAPLFVQVSVSQLAYEQTVRERVDTNGNGGNDSWQRTNVVTQERQGSIALGLELRTTAMATSFEVLDDYQSDSEPYAPNRKRLSGPSLFLFHDSAERTAMGGARRGFSSRLASSLFPNDMSTLPFTVIDVGSGLSIYSPLPFSRRHTLTLMLGARALIHEQSDVRLLRVGGVSVFGETLYGSPDRRSEGWFEGVPRSRRFSEPLRGYETLAFLTNQVGSAQLRYVYPIIIDAGFASTLGFLPSFFVRQLDLELFGVAATLSSSRVREEGKLAAGAAITFRTRFYLVPLSVQYQIAQRFTDDRALQHNVSLGVGL